MTLIEHTKAYEKQFTVSGYVVNPARDRLLLILHKKLGAWLPPGGHIDDNETPQAAVVREVWEETGVVAALAPGPGVDLGLDGVREDQLETPLSMSYQLIPERPGEPAHIHLDMAFLLTAAHETEVRAQLTEVDKAAWFSLDEIEALDAFRSVVSVARHVLGAG